jgi:hypothetical protein
MQFIIATILSLAVFAAATPTPQNAGRPVPNGSCCVANTSLKQDVCNVNGQTGRCVPSGANNCTTPALTLNIETFTDEFTNRRLPVDMYRGQPPDLRCQGSGARQAPVQAC